MIQPAFEDETGTLWEGEALDVLSQLPRHSFDMLLTDPPYSSGGFTRQDRILPVHAKYVNSDSFSGQKLSGFGGDSRDQRGFEFWCSLWLSVCHQLLKPGSLAAVFCDWRQVALLIDVFQAGGFIYRGIITWHKPASRPVPGRPTNECEFLVWGSAGHREATGKCFRGWYEVAAPRNRDHITEKPLGLITQLLDLCPDGGRVLDPFGGSGTTAVAAKQRGQHWTLIDHDPHWIAHTITRLGQTVFVPPDPVPEQVKIFTGFESGTVFNDDNPDPELAPDVFEEGVGA